MPPQQHTLAHLPFPPDGKCGWPWTVESSPPRRKQAPWPRISIVTPSYNQGQFIEETIRSVLLQKYPNLEYIVMDGGSTDNTLALLDKYRPFLDYVVSQPDDGQADAVNQGFARSTGTIMGWLNSDDILEPGALFHIARAFMADPEITFVTGFRRIYDRDSQFVNNWIRDLPTPRYMMCYCCVAQETTYWRRTAWEQLGELDNEMQFCLDYEYWVRAICAGYNFTLLPHYLGGFRDYAENKSSTLHATFQHEMAILYQRYGIALDEQEALANLGPMWWQKYHLIQYLCESTHFADSPRRMIQILHWLEHPLVARFTANLVRQYRRSINPRTRREVTFLRALLLTLTNHAWRKSQPSVPKHIRQPLSAIPLHNQTPISINALFHDEVLNAHDEVTIDGLVLGRGWYPMEIDEEGMPFRWIKERAQFIVTLPTVRQRTLRIELLTGPSLENQEFGLQVTDQNGQIVAERWISGHTVVKFDLPLRMGQSRSFFLQLADPTQAIKLQSCDTREYLYFRIIQFGWDDDFYAQPSNWLSQTGAPDIVTPAVLPAPTIPQQAIPHNGLFLGDGWYDLELRSDHGFRWVNDDAELIVTYPTDTIGKLDLELEPGPGRTVPIRIAVVNTQRAVIDTITLEQRSCATITLPLQPGVINRFSLQITHGYSSELIDQRILNFRIFSIHWHDHQPNLPNINLQHRFDVWETLRGVENRIPGSQLPVVGFLIRTGIRLAYLGKLWAAERHFLDGIIQVHHNL